MASALEVHPGHVRLLIHFGYLVYSVSTNDFLHVEDNEFILCNGERGRSHHCFSYVFCICKFGDTNISDSFPAQMDFGPRKVVLKFNSNKSFLTSICNG